MKTILLLLIAACFIGCKSTEESMYVQPMVKTLTGLKKIGEPYPHVVLPGDTIKVIYLKRFK